ncbi:PepSY domain-containing protein [Alteromonas sp. a30]|uniref:PepSY domain-containing protein n=1 Tax=Alteromonas sp. a30 TaxID=2730917 RepID=UPI002280718B|nr:peptidase [Alteromonas sp. a30]MCY7295168.1 peptidase [Alteromonas sp. a30]
MMRFIILLTTLVVSWFAFADPPMFGQHNKSTAQTKSQAAKQAMRRYKGRVLKVETQQTFFRVKVLQKSGRVVVVEIKRAMHITPVLTEKNENDN